ncbi:Phosphoribulokinase/uridine kinase [Cynara cardunculus var. scolymus]|uniref:Phosphoribulokinase/uridine kinase n=1 Tax=Cynara cardunculus var. scolymus TaxID=59895 RepID=A0A124SE82_CYNCS|nr:Phosphoribulokinase/uridine kinase [Cynara cardunculus var. scolymus]
MCPFAIHQTGLLLFFHSHPPLLYPIYKIKIAFETDQVKIKKVPSILNLGNPSRAYKNLVDMICFNFWCSSLQMGSNPVEDLIEASSGVHFSGLHRDGIETRNTQVEQASTSMTGKPHKQPFLHDQRVVLVNQVPYFPQIIVTIMQGVFEGHMIGLDSFYHSLTSEELSKVHEYNFDHPDAFDTEKLLSAMEMLKHGKAVDIPKYDFKSYKNNVSRRVNPSDVIILEGILIFHDPRVRDMMNMKIFVDTDADVRLARRIRRDTGEKGRDIGMVLDQKYADIIIPRGGDNHVAIDLIVQHIRTKLGQHDLCKIYPNLYVIQSTFQIRGMHTLIRDAQTTKHDFVVEHGLGHLPFTEKQVTTPTGSVYTGVDFCKRLCGVSVIRSGESMENALRACCKGIKIGKILIHREGDNGQQLIYEKLPQDISDRHVLLLDPILGTGVPEANIIFLNLISAPQGVHVVCKKFPRIKIVTSEIETGLNQEFRVVPGMGEFGDRYFGTDDE